MPEVVANIKAIVAALPDSRVILETLPYVVEGYRPNINRQIRALNEQLRAATPFVFDLNALLADGEELDPRNSSDGLHLSANAYQVWSAALSPVLREALRQAKSSARIPG